MTAKTRLGYEGYGVERAGSFLGKTSSAGGHPVGVITRLSLDGYGVRRYRDFSGKASSTGGHPVGIITRLSLDGYGVRRYRGFAGKTPSGGVVIHPVGILTRLSLDGYGVRRYRDFTGKTLTDVIIGGGKRWDWEEYKPPKTVPVKSSDIESISYDKNTSQLIVNFKNDTSYNYSHIPEHKVKNLKRAKSPGGYLHNNIKGKHFVARIK